MSFSHYQAAVLSSRANTEPSWTSLQDPSQSSDSQLSDNSLGPSQPKALPAVVPSHDSEGPVRIS